MLAMSYPMHGPQHPAREAIEGVKLVEDGGQEHGVHKFEVVMLRLGSLRMLV
jgi:hypothetical protein